MTKSWTLEVKGAEDGSEDCILEFPDDMMQELDWRTDDVIEWHLTEDGNGATIENITWKQRQADSQKIMGPGTNEWHGVANPNWKVE